MAINHAKVLTVPDGFDTSEARSSDWNADHVIEADTVTAAMLSKSGILTDVLRGDGLWTPPNSPLRGIFYATDCPYLGSVIAPWLSAIVASGTIMVVASDINHPGVLQLRGSGTANGGYLVYTLAGVLLLGGGESSDMIFRVKTTANTTCYLGFHDSASVAAPTDGAWINIAGTTLLGRCKDNAGPTDTATSYEITQDVWYRARIVVNANATRVDFYLFTCADGAQVWTGNVQANIPVVAGRECGHAIVATNSGTGSANLLDLDYMNLAIDRVLVR